MSSNLVLELSLLVYYTTKIKKNDEGFIFVLFFKFFFDISFNILEVCNKRFAKTQKRKP